MSKQTAKSTFNDKATDYLALYVNKKRKAKGKNKRWSENETTKKNLISIWMIDEHVVPYL